MHLNPDPGYNYNNYRTPFEMHIFAIYSTLIRRDGLRKGGELAHRVLNTFGVNFDFLKIGIYYFSAVKRN